MMRLLGPSVAFVLLYACGSSGGPASASPSVASPSTTATCSLPVIIRTFDPATHTWSADAAGFLKFPGGGFTAANASGVRYDANRHIWLPSGIPTPDRAGYVYTAYNDGGGPTSIHKVSLDSDHDQLLLSGSWIALGFVGDALYLAESIALPAGANTGGGYSEGRLARTDLSGAAPVFLTQRSGPWWISALGAWTLDRVDGMLQAPDRLLHVDVASGETQPWLTGFGNLMIAGFDAAGHPFVVSQTAGQVLLVLDAKTSRTVFAGPMDEGWPGLPYVIDGEDVWFSGFGIKDPIFEAPAWLYRPGTGLKPSAGVSGAQVSVAGPCAR